jgi:hypothetical protein
VHSAPFDRLLGECRGAMSDRGSTVISIIQGHPGSSAQVFGAVTISSARLAAACPVSAVTGFRRFEIVA